MCTHTLEFTRLAQKGLVSIFKVDMKPNEFLLVLNLCNFRPWETVNSSTYVTSDSGVWSHQELQSLFYCMQCSRCTSVSENLPQFKFESVPLRACSSKEWSSLGTYVNMKGNGIVNCNPIPSLLFFCLWWRWLHCTPSTSLKSGDMDQYFRKMSGKYFWSTCQ